MRTVDLSMREDLYHGRTIDALLRNGWTSGWQRVPYRRAAEIAVSIRDDSRLSVRLGAMPPTMASASRWESRYGKTESELRGIALGLITAGFLPSEIEVGDAPDARVTIDGEKIWVEFAEVVDAPSARYTNMMFDLNRDILDDIDSDKELLAAAAGHHVEIRFAVSPGKMQARQARRDILGLLRKGAVAAIPAREFTSLTSTKTFVDLEAAMYRAPWPYGVSGGSPHIFHVQPSAHSFDPLSIAAIASHRLEAKRRNGDLYGVTPIWLVLGVTDIRGVWGASMHMLAQRCPPIDPYDGVIVHNESTAILWSADGEVSVRDIA